MILSGSQCLAASLSNCDINLSYGDRLTGRHRMWSYVSLRVSLKRSGKLVHMFGDFLTTVDERLVGGQPVRLAW